MNAINKYSFKKLISKALFLYKKTRCYTVPSCTHHVRLSKRMSSLIAPMIESVWKFLPWCWNLRKFFYIPSARSNKWTEKIELWGVTEAELWSTIQLYKVLCNLCMEGKVAWMTEKISPFQLSWYPIPFLLLDQCIVHHFLCHPPSKSQDEISFKEG
jgi:hypothetical protein